MEFRNDPRDGIQPVGRVLLSVLTAMVALIDAPLAVSQAETHSYRSYAVAADHHRASAAGAEMLALGGNAVDSAVAASFTLSVVRPFSCGIGGGGFMVISIPDGSTGQRIERAICYRETAPIAAVPTVYEANANPRASLDGGMACGVPGTVAGLLYALETYGTLDRATVMAPAIRAAREGFAVDHAYLSAASSAAERIGESDRARERFAFTWERLLGKGQLELGDIILNPELGALLEAIARDGGDAFYQGDSAAAIREAVNRDARLSGFEEGEWFVHQDFESPVVEDGEPIFVAFQGKRALLMPPPSSGGIAIGQILSLADRRGFDALCERSDRGAYAHELTEAFQFAFADRARFLADARFSEVPVAELLGGSRLDRFAERIDPDRTFEPSYYGSADQIGNDDGTSHISVVDQWGGAVACTETINTAFGSLVAVPGLGFCLNNEMDDFTTRRGEPNVYGLRQSNANLPQPGKRPLSSMSPVIAVGEDGSLVVVGASGGPRIITATVQALFNVLMRGMNAEEAVRAKRLHHQWLPSVLEVESGFSESARESGQAVADRLRELGHEVEWTQKSAVVQMVVRRTNGSIEAASDPRKGGRPAGE